MWLYCEIKINQFTSQSGKTTACSRSSIICSTRVGSKYWTSLKNNLAYFASPDLVRKLDKISAKCFNFFFFFHSFDACCSILIYQNDSTIVIYDHKDITITIYDQNESTIVIYNSNDSSSKYYKTMIPANFALARSKNYNCKVCYKLTRTLQL